MVGRLGWSPAGRHRSQAGPAVCRRRDGSAARVHNVGMSRLEDLFHHDATRTLLGTLMAFAVVLAFMLGVIAAGYLLVLVIDLLTGA